MFANLADDLSATGSQANQRYHHVCNYASQTSKRKEGPERALRVSKKDHKTEEKKSRLLPRLSQGTVSEKKKKFS